MTLTRRALVLAGPAALAGSAISAHADGAATAGAPVRQLVDGLLQIMKAGPGTPFLQRYDMLAPVIDRVFDLDAVLRASVGLSWSALPPDQQDQLRSAFRRYTVASYVNSFDHFDGQRFTVEPQPRPAGNGEQIVVTRITPRSGDGHEIDYVMRNTPSGWRAVDVLADGARRGAAFGFSSFAVSRWRVGAGEQPGQQVTRLVGRHELRGDDRRTAGK
jgi:phospholipid transport system substrate-binding protein